MKVFVLYFLELSCWVMRNETYVYEKSKGNLDLVCCWCNIASRNPFTLSSCNKVYLNPSFYQNFQSNGIGIGGTIYISFGYGLINGVRRCVNTCMMLEKGVEEFLINGWITNWKQKVDWKLLYLVMVCDGELMFKINHWEDSW